MWILKQLGKTDIRLPAFETLEKEEIYIILLQTLCGLHWVQPAHRLVAIVFPPSGLALLVAHNTLA